jgi:hypothetical protein
LDSKVKALGFCFLPIRYKSFPLLTFSQSTPPHFHRSRDKVTLSPNIHENGPLIPKHKNNDDDEEEVDTDLETDRLLGHQMLDDGFYDDKNWSESKQQHRGLIPSKISPKVKQNSAISKSNSSSILRHGLNVLLPASTSSECCINNNSSPSMLTTGGSFHQSRSLKTSPALNSSNLMSLMHPNIESETANDSSPRKADLLDEQKDEQLTNNNQTDTLELCNLDSDLVDSPGGSSSDKSKKDEMMTGEKKKKNKNKEGKIDWVVAVVKSFQTHSYVQSQQCFQTTPWTFK